MQVTRFNISKPKKYVKNGQEKTVWNNIGTLTEFVKDNGSVSRIIEIPAIGLEANVFLIEPKDNQARGQAAPRNTASGSSAGDAIEYPEEEINPDDIPF